ncbi:MAG: hypothetical protein V7L29_15695 [Nostoc sp.]
MAKQNDVSKHIVLISYPGDLAAIACLAQNKLITHQQIIITYSN